MKCFSAYFFQTQALNQYSWSAIIDEFTFKKVQDRLQKNKNKYKPESWKTHPFPLTELIECSECGKPMGGKSGHGRNEKHFYYGHPQIKNPLHLKPNCQIKNVRALRLEELIIGSLKELMSNQSLIEKWISIYKEKSVSDLPDVRSRLKQLDIEIQTTSKRIANLVKRLSDLPTDVQEGFYEQIKSMTDKLNQLKNSREQVRAKSIDLVSQEIDGQGLQERIKNVVKRLELTAKEEKTFDENLKLTGTDGTLLPFPPGVGVRVKKVLVPETGLEPAHLSAPDPKSGVSAIPPLGQKN